MKWDTPLCLILKYRYVFGHKSLFKPIPRTSRWYQNKGEREVERENWEEFSQSILPVNNVTNLNLLQWRRLEVREIMKKRRKDERNKSKKFLIWRIFYRIILDIPWAWYTQDLRFTKYRYVLHVYHARTWGVCSFQNWIHMISGVRFQACTTLISFLILSLYHLAKLTIYHFMFSVMEKGINA